MRGHQKTSNLEEVEMTLRILLTIFVATVLAAALTGCDGDVGFHGAAGAVESSSGRKLVRGLAAKNEMINEDEDKTKNRRNVVEAIAEREGLNLSDDLGDILKNNKLFDNVVFTNLMKDVRGLPIYPVQVDFDINGGYHVQLQFLIEQMTMLGFVHLTKLPIFDKGSIKHGEDALPISGLDLFTLLLAGDQNALKSKSDKVWGVVQTRQLAESNARKQTACENEVQEQANNFEVDPSLSDAEKDAEITKFQSDQTATIKKCLAL